MTCAPAKSLLEAYLDDELDAAQSAQVAEHLASCSSCAEIHSQLLELRAGIRAHAPYYRAPARLPGRIHRALRQAATDKAQPWRWIAIAASILLAVSLAWNVAAWRSHTSSGLVAEDIFASHMRALTGTHLLDVPSSDQHTVKPWFNGKLDFSPDVRDFTAQGFPLIGGRIDYVADRMVAALVYQRRQHVIDLFTWPSTAPESGAELSRNGYHMVHWSAAGMAWWAVSDLSVAELRQFENLYRQ
jgi:anti-sigma factor RsiW